MKAKDIVWFESEIDRIVLSIGHYNETHSECPLGLEDLESSVTYRSFLASHKTNNSLLFRLFLLVLALSFGLTYWTVLFPLVKLDINSECLVKLPDSLQNAFVPPNRCDFCRNLTTIERVQHLSPHQFTSKYAYSKVPVIVTDATVNWTSLQVFSFDYFKQIYTEKDFGRKKNCQFFPYKTEFHSLREVFRMEPSRAMCTTHCKPWYIGWSNCDYSITNQLRAHYRKPYFLPNDSESIRTDWIFMGTPNNGAHMHIDHVGRPSWQAQIRGTKRWFLEPPLECYAECNDHTVDVSPGDIIVLDTNVWYHKTLIVGDQVSITIGAEYD